MIQKLKDVCFQNRYSQLDAESIMDLACDSHDVKLLPSSKNYDLFTTYEKASAAICHGEVITLGKARYANIKYWNGDFVSSNNNIIESRDNNLLRGRYLYYFLSYSAKDYYVEATTYPKFDQKSFDEHTIDVPDIYTQDKRLEILDSLTELIEKEELQIKQFDELTKSRFNEMFGKDIKIVKIGDVLKTTSGGTPSKGKLEYYLNGNIPWLCSGEVNAGIITEVKNKITELGLKNSSAKWIPENSVVVAMYGATAGKVGLLKIKTTTNQAVCSILPDSKFVPEFLYYAVGSKTEELVSKAWGGAQPNISQGIIKNTCIPFPSLAQQNEFASFVAEVDKLKFSRLVGNCSVFSQKMGGICA